MTSLHNIDPVFLDQPVPGQPDDLDSAGKSPADAAKAARKKLFYECRNAWEMSGSDDRAAALALAEDYTAFLRQVKTEREFVESSVEALEALGFMPLASKASLLPGDKVYKNIRNRGIVAAVIGRKPAAAGLNLIGAHIDSPRIDLKPNPVYEDSEMVFFKTHYYGGIKKYQWTAIPLALHGVIIREDGSRLDIRIGDQPGDPVLTITDLLPHLGVDQMSRKGTELIKGEELNVLAGSLPYPDTESSGRFKLGLLDWLAKEYGISERDFLTAELELVPALEPRDVGLDRSFIGAYAHDDRICAYSALHALLGIDRLDRTAVVMLFDKEEIGSEGNTSAQSRLYEHFLYEVYAKSAAATGPASQLDFYRLLENSYMLSGDVTNGFDPTYASVSDPRNSAYLGKGISLMKYGGSRGKAGTSDASAELMAKVIRLLNDSRIAWQTGELGKVDAGGGGTIAKFMANLGMEVLDCGVPLLSMHAPFEVASKIDLYHTFLAYQQFLLKMA